MAPSLFIYIFLKIPHLSQKYKSSEKKIYYSSIAKIYNTQVNEKMEVGTKKKQKDDPYTTFIASILRNRWKIFSVLFIIELKL